MSKELILAAINSSYTDLPKEADPYGGCLDFEAPRKYINSNMEKTLAFFHEAGKKKVDLVCTNEDFLGMSKYVRDIVHPEIFLSLAEEIPGPISNEIGAIAKLYSMYIAVNYYEKCEGKIFNTSVLFGRDGEIIGKYRKIHPADGERWFVTGGDEIPVFETDIGKIGFAICYDIIFPELSRILGIKGADIIIHQTQGWGTGGKSCSVVGEAFMRTRAAENSVYFVVAKNIQPDDDGGKSCIIDNYGNIMAQSVDAVEGLTIAKFTPDFDLEDPYNYDNFFAGVTSTKVRQLLARVSSCYSTLIDEHPPVMDRYEGIRFKTEPDEVREIFNKWRSLSEEEKCKYHW